MSVQVKGSGTIGGIDEGLVVSGIVTATKVLSEGTSNCGGIFGKLSVGLDNLYLTVQPVSGQSQTHLNFNNGDQVHIGHTNGSTLTVNGGIKPKSDSNSDLGLTGTRFRAAYVDTYYGDGSNLTGITGTTINSNTNNYLITGTGTANTLQGESNLTFDGSTLTVNAFIESIGNSGRGAKLGNIAIGYSPNNNTVQTLSNGSNLHLQYSVNGNVLANEGGGDLRTADIIPHTNNSASLGTNAIRWANIHTNDLNLSNEGNVNEVDGTWGNYTIQEGESDLFLINRRNGKRYKFNLTEID